MTNEITITLPLASAAPIVTIKNNAVVADSRNVAAYFGKQHAHVLRDIDDLILAAPEAASNFGVCSYQSVEGGRSYRAFDMTRDGFKLLAMGFTGAKALQFKLRYIAQYNLMETELKRIATPVLSEEFAQIVTKLVEMMRQRIELMGQQTQLLVSLVEERKEQVRITTCHGRRVAAKELEGRENVGQQIQPRSRTPVARSTMTMDAWASIYDLHLTPSMISKLGWSMRKLYEQRGVCPNRKVRKTYNLSKWFRTRRLVKTYRRDLLDEAARSLGIVA